MLKREMHKIPLSTKLYLQTLTITKEIFFWLNHITYISNDKYKADLIIPICQIVFPQNAGIFIVTP